MQNLNVKFILLFVISIGSASSYGVEIDTINFRKGLFSMNPAGDIVVQVDSTGIHKNNLSENTYEFIPLNDKVKMSKFSSVVRSNNNFGIVSINKVKANHFELSLSLYNWDLDFIESKKYSFKEIGETFALEFFQEMCCHNDSIFFTNLSNNAFYSSNKKGGRVLGDIAIDVLNNQVHFIESILSTNKQLDNSVQNFTRYQVFNNTIYFTNDENGEKKLVAYDLKNRTQINDIDYQRAYSLKGKRGELYLSYGYLIARSW